MQRNDRQLLLALIVIIIALVGNATVAAAPECQPTHGATIPVWITVAYIPLCSIGNFVLSHRDVIDGLSTCIIAAFTIVLARSTVCLWRETKRLAQGGEKQREDVQESIRIAREAYVAEHRTWMQIRAIGVESVVFDGKDIRVRIAIEAKNVGPFPAVDVHLGCQPYRSHGYVVSKATLQETLAKEKVLRSQISRNQGPTGVVVMPGDPTLCTFTASAVQDARMDAETERQRAFGVPEKNSPLTLSAAFYVLYKSLTSDDWRFTGHVVVFRKNDGSAWSPQDGEIIANNIKATILPSHSDMA